MAINIIPSDYKTLPKDVIKFIDKVKSLYSKTDMSHCYLYIKPKIKDIKTTAVLIDPLRGISTIGISVWIPSRVDDTLEPAKLLSGINKYYKMIPDLFINDNRLLNDDGTSCYNFYSKVIFTRLNADTIDKWNRTLDQPYITYISSEQISNLTFEILFSNEGCLINTDQISIIRGILFPEIKIKDVYDRIKVLDNEQELFAKRIPNGHYMVSGVPGSGKTVMLIARAIYLLKENPDWKIKIVTYNRSLNSRIENRFKQRFEDSHISNELFENISITTFHSMAKEVRNLPMPNNPDDSFWDYELPLEALEKAIPIYDAILIDEYQDFYNHWIQLCIKVTKKIKVGKNHTENIFLAGDRLQNIVSPGIHSWTDVGINIQGSVRSKLLKHTYRTGGSIIELALKMLMSEVRYKNEVNTFYSSNIGITNESDIKDEIFYIEGDYSIIGEVLYKLVCVKNYKPGEILILCPKRNQNKLYDQFPHSIRDITIITKDLIKNYINITTYQSSKGLETRICILVDIDQVRDLKLIYVGMTRAFQFLYIHSTNFANSEIATNLKNNSFTDEAKNTPGIPKLKDFDFPLELLKIS